MWGRGCGVGDRGQMGEVECVGRESGVFQRNQRYLNWLLKILVSKVIIQGV